MMDLRKTPVFNEAEFEQWFGKEHEKQSNYSEGLIAQIKGGPHELTKENFIAALEQMNNKSREPIQFILNAAILLSMDDEYFTMTYNSPDTKCICSVDMVNKINWRAYKLKLIDKYTEI